MATDPTRTTGGTLVPIANREPILRSGRREISLLVAGENLSVTQAGYAADEPVAGPHVHHLHTDVFYVLEGELTFEIGAESETVTIGAGGFVAAPPGVAHSFRTANGQPARWLTSTHATAVANLRDHARRGRTCTAAVSAPTSAKGAGATPDDCPSAEVSPRTLHPRRSPIERSAACLARARTRGRAWGVESVDTIGGSAR